MRLSKLAFSLVLAMAALAVLSSSAASEESPCTQKGRAQVQGEPVAVESPQSAPQDKERASAAAVRLPVYKPPLRGAPTSRVAGGARGFAFWSLDGKLVQN